ncbi:MAG: InlB B-repeat-containing protein [Clostridiales bacterium]|nr:InlB B-repeat-containing protein [Clostridiales bacterium]
MKKTKKLLSLALAASMCATAAFGLAACSKGTDGSGNGDSTTGSTYTISFNAGSGTVTPATATTNAEGKLASLPTPTYTGYTFDAWYTQQNGSGDKITLSYKFTSDTTVYANWTSGGTPNAEGEFTVTFVVDSDEGTLVGSETATTTDGKLASFPTVTPASGYTFVQWEDAIGEVYTTSSTFTANTTLYALMNNSGISVGGPEEVSGTSYISIGATPYYELTKTFDVDDGDTNSEYPTMGKQYVRTGLGLAKDTTLSFTIEGEEIEFYIEADSKGLVEKKKDASTVTTNFDDTYNIYLKYWSDSSKWTITMQCENNEDEVAVVGGEAIEPGTAYLVGDVAASNITWDSWREGAIKLEESVSGFTGAKEYKRLDVTLAVGDSFQFILVGATTEDGDITWVNTLGNTKGNLKVEGDNVTVVNAGVYDFYISFEDSKIYYDYTPA